MVFGGGVVVTSAEIRLAGLQWLNAHISTSVADTVGYLL